MTHDFPTIEEVIAMHNALRRKTRSRRSYRQRCSPAKNTVAAGELIYDISDDRSDLPQIRKDIGHALINLT